MRVRERSAIPAPLSIRADQLIYRAPRSPSREIPARFPARKSRLAGIFSCNPENQGHWEFLFSLKLLKENVGSTITIIPTMLKSPTQSTETFLTQKVLKSCITD